MFKDITNDNKKVYKITSPGEYIFYFENKTGKIIFDVLCENANVNIFGLYQGKKSDQFKLNIIQNHIAPNSESTSLVKSILKDESKFNFTGTIYIDKKAENSIVNLKNKNLLLSKKSSAITKPQLEVVPKNVKCTHSASTSPVDENQVNYLLTRGITKSDAEKLLVEGFAKDISQYKKQAL